MRWAAIFSAGARFCTLFHRILAPDARILAPTIIYFDVVGDIVGNRVDTEVKNMQAIIGRIREKVNDVDGAVLVDCIRIGTDMSQGDGFDHYMVTARAQSGRYITWRAIDRKENGTSDLVLDGGRYDWGSRQNALCDMYGRARDALASAHWEYPHQEGI